MFGMPDTPSHEISEDLFVRLRKNGLKSFKIEAKR